MIRKKISKILPMISMIILGGVLIFTATPGWGWESRAGQRLGRNAGVQSP